MANNRMVLVCNTCLPGEWSYWKPGGEEREEAVCVIGKWYPFQDYAYVEDLKLGQRINDFLNRHAHIESSNCEWPVRLEYEIPKEG